MEGEWRMASQREARKPLVDCSFAWICDHGGEMHCEHESWLSDFSFILVSWSMYTVRILQIK